MENYTKLPRYYFRELKENKYRNYTRLPKYYFRPSRVSGMMQDRRGIFYKPVNNQ